MINQLFRLSHPRRGLAGWMSLLILLIGPIAALPIPQATRAQSLAAVPVHYDSASNTISVGENYSDPALSAYPSAPGAPKSPITIPQIAAALNNPALLQDQGGGTWLLNANLVISPTARLDITSDTVSWLRLLSAPSFIRMVASGGYLKLQSTKVTSWDTSAGAVDTNYTNGRAYLLALSGGRMDVLGTEIGYLGFADGEPSGMSWRLRATAGRPETGATGTVDSSNVHDNYFGLYSFAAYGLMVTNSQFHNNIVYGFDPHDGSTGFQVSYNTVYANGKHGIIFSRGCTQNEISHNLVYNNASHGIMMDRGSNDNTIADNVVYGNDDGVAIFESSNNTVRNNLLHDNNRGVRINATYDVTDVFDGISTGNTVISNTIQNNAQYGIYLYERADRNSIEQNVITGSTSSGVYIKTGGNRVQGNTIRLNGTGVAIIGGALTPFPPGGPKPVPALEQPGDNNTFSGNTIADNDTSGIQLKAATHTLIGTPTPANAQQDGNFVQTNGSYGVTMNTATTDTTLSGNTIQANGTDGVLIKDAGSARNKISRNSISANGGQGIKLGPGANGGIAAPTITSAPGAPTVAGKAPPNASVEIYRDPNGQGRTYVGSATANGAGDWSLALPAGDNPQAGLLTAVAILPNGNSSAFGGNILGGAHAVYQVGAGRNGELTVFISGPGAMISLPDIQQALAVLSPTVTLLENQGNGIWQANASLFLNRGVTLTLGLDTVTWLKLRSQSTGIQLSAAQAPADYNYDSFVTLRTYNGAILIDGVKITSWDPAQNDYDRDISNGRAYIIAKYDARMDIKNADLSYLGSADGESYGVSWRDINDADAPDTLLTRVTGDVQGSNFSHNYYGIYTFQASGMTFRANQFHDNIGYGFDPHDFSNHFVIEDNQSFANGNHGFIVSRGVNNFVFRRNKSYNNRYTIGDADRNAQGFMLDPGSPNSIFPQVPSHDNLLEDNQAWGNDGYGLRVVASNNNTVTGNSFTGNLQGITLEQGSAGNLIQHNTIDASGLYGIYLIGGADGNTLAGNTITHSGKHGIYVKTGGNTITENVSTDNGTIANGGAGIAFLQESTSAAAAADLTLPGASTSLAENDPTLLSPPALASAVAGNVVTNNTLVHNIGAGIELKQATGTRVDGNSARNNGANGIYLSNGATNSIITHNTLDSNIGYGIRANGADVIGNTWSENSIFGNSVGGIATTSSANGGIQPPTLAVSGHTVTGTTVPGAVVEIYSDAGKQGRFFEGRVTADTKGAFAFTATKPWQAPNQNASATDPSGDSSGFTYNVGQFVAFWRVQLPLARR
jgi:parallel beta-helix repeat protein